MDERYDEKSKHLVELSRRAWDELMVDKMKKAFDEEPGSTMNQAAKATIDHGMDVWEHMKKGTEIPKASIEEYQNKLMKIWGS